MALTTLLNAVTAVGASAAKLLARQEDKHAVSINIGGTVDPTAVTVTLEGTINAGVDWATLGTHAMTAGELTSQFALFFVVDSPVSEIRVNLTVLTGGTDPIVTVRHREQTRMVHARSRNQET